MKTKAFILGTSLLCTTFLTQCSFNRNIEPVGPLSSPAVAYQQKYEKLANDLVEMRVPSATNHQRLLDAFYIYSQSGIGQRVIAGIDEDMSFFPSVINTNKYYAMFHPYTNDIRLASRMFNEEESEEGCRQLICETLGHELLHGYQKNHNLIRGFGLSPYQFIMTEKLAEAEAYAWDIAHYNSQVETISNKQIGRLIIHLMKKDTSYSLWQETVGIQAINGLRTHAIMGHISNTGNNDLYNHTLAYYQKQYGISPEEITGANLTDAQEAKYLSVCTELREEGYFDEGEKELKNKQDIASFFPTYVSTAKNAKDIILYFNQFAMIQSTHVAEAQTLLNAKTPAALAALQSLLLNESIKGDLSQLRPQTHEGRRVLISVQNKKAKLPTPQKERR
ncbi:MAG: hypothetical protein IKY98_04770 [Alphaproteobacteria bacterium]|nr:hypothetical protein [Alphaproteobacteria bacterium]